MFAMSCSGVDEQRIDVLLQEPEKVTAQYFRVDGAFQ